MSATRCPRCLGIGSIEYDRGDDCIPAVDICSSCAGTGVIIAPRAVRGPRA